MSFKQQIRTLISEGRTIEALRLVQSTVKLTDYSMYTQALLLESQFIDQRRTVALSADFSHIHGSLLQLAEEVERRRLTEKDVDNATANPKNTSWIYVGIGILIAFAVLAWQLSKVANSNV
jgi:hypothetical protein